MDSSSQTASLDASASSAQKSSSLPGHGQGRGHLLPTENGRYKLESGYYDNVVLDTRSRLEELFDKSWESDSDTSGDDDDDDSEVEETVIVPEQVSSCIYFFLTLSWSVCAIKVVRGEVCKVKRF
jgi:hypothetical protein